LHQPHTQTIVNINTANRIDNINNEPQHSHQHLNVTNDSNNNDEENDTDILDESDSDLEPGLNKISTGNSGISDEENETHDETRLNFHNSNILINHRYYQQQQQQHLFQQYNTYNDQENDPHKPILNSKQPKQNRHKNIKVNKVKTNRNNNNNNNIANSNVDSSRNLKIKIKKNNLKESKLGINHNNKDELNNSEDEYEQRPLRQSIGLNQNVNSEQNHVKHTGTINENHDSFITAETIEEVIQI
jgi:hypothetical protein